MSESFYEKCLREARADGLQLERGIYLVKEVGNINAWYAALLVEEIERLRARVAELESESEDHYHRIRELGEYNNE